MTDAVEFSSRLRCQYHVQNNREAEMRAYPKASPSLGTPVHRIWGRQRPICLPSAPVALRAISGTRLRSCNRVPCVLFIQNNLGNLTNKGQPSK